MEPRVFFREACGQGVICHGPCSCLAVPYPSYSLVVRPLFAPFQCCSRAGGQCCSRGRAVLLQSGGPVLLQRGSSAAPEGAPVLLQRGGSTSGTQWTAPVPIQPCPLLRGYVLTQAIDIFHIPYPLCLLVVKPIDMPSFSTGRGRGEVAGATPLFRVSFGPGPPLQWTLRGPVQHSPRGGRSRQVIPAGRLGFRRNDPV